MDPLVGAQACNHLSGHRVMGFQWSHEKKVKLGRLTAQILPGSSELANALVPDEASNKPDNERVAGNSIPRSGAQARGAQPFRIEALARIHSVHAPAAENSPSPWRTQPLTDREIEIGRADAQYAMCEQARDPFGPAKNPACWTSLAQEDEAVNVINAARHPGDRGAEHAE